MTTIFINFFNIDIYNIYIRISLVTGSPLTFSNHFRGGKRCKIINVQNAAVRENVFPAMLVLEKTITMSMFSSAQSAIILKRKKNGPGRQPPGAGQLTVHSAESPVKRTKKLRFI